MELNKNYNLYLIYVQFVGKDNDNKNVYELLFNYDHESVWVEGWEEIPACNEKNLKPNDDDYERVIEIRTDVKLILGQDNCCVSFSDVKDNIAAIAYEDIQQYEEYPDNRIVLHYGQDIDEVNSILSKSYIEMLDITNKK